MELQNESTKFIPSLHGFHFANNFNLTWDMFGLKGNGLSWNLGLCGGMCVTALDRFYSNKPVPVMANPPVEGTELFKEILERECASLFPVHWDKFYELQCLKDFGPAPMITLGLMTKSDVPMVKKSIEQDRPKTLGLICVDGSTANPTDNHQVLATGYRYDTNSKDLTIDIYDPNYPDEDDIHISMNTGLPDNAINISHSKGDPIRGFFAIKYFPPEIESTTL
jgi:hypothetical protein